MGLDLQERQELRRAARAREKERQRGEEDDFSWIIPDIEVDLSAD